MQLTLGILLFALLASPGLAASPTLETSAVSPSSETPQPSPQAQAVTQLPGVELGTPEPANSSPLLGANQELRGWVQDALGTIQLHLGASPSGACRRYFGHLDFDLEEWLVSNGPPYIVPVALDRHRRRSWHQACAVAESRPPFSHLLLNKHCFQQKSACDLASLILHELGHLARHDTRDNEPADFFASCRLSDCVDPEKFR